jgi:hypothetical protein
MSCRVGGIASGPSGIEQRVVTFFFVEKWRVVTCCMHGRIMHAPCSLARADGAHAPPLL